MLNKYCMKAYVYCHIQDLNQVDGLKEKAIRFAANRNIDIYGFYASDVCSLIRLMTMEQINTLLINKHSLTINEQRLLTAFCRRKNITILRFE